MTEPKIIPPSIGRRVWYWPSEGDRIDAGWYLVNTGRAGEQPCDAGVAYVHGDRMVNLSVADHNGNVRSRTSVPLVQPGDAVPTHRPYATWMPYQVGQATSTESPTAPAGAQPTEGA